MRAPFAALPVVLLLSACADPAGTPLALGDVCRAEHDGQMVQLEGHIDASGSVFCSNIGGGPVTCGMELKQAPGEDDHVRLDVEQGGGGSQMEEVPERFSRADLRVHAEDGSLVALDDRVVVTGEAHVAVNPGYDTVCYVTVRRIERAGAASEG